MATSQRFFVIMLNGSSKAERDGVHARVKKATSVYWHQFNDVWIVRGGTQAKDWSDRLQPVLQRTGGLFVFELPDEKAARSWAYFGPDADTRGSWFHKNYTSGGR